MQRILWKSNFGQLHKDWINKSLQKQLEVFHYTEISLYLVADYDDDDDGCGWLEEYQSAILQTSTWG